MWVPNFPRGRKIITFLLLHCFLSLMNFLSMEPKQTISKTESTWVMKFHKDIRHFHFLPLQDTAPPLISRHLLSFPLFSLTLKPPPPKKNTQTKKKKQTKMRAKR